MHCHLHAVLGRYSYHRMPRYRCEVPKYRMMSSIVFWHSRWVNSQLAAVCLTTVEFLAATVIKQKSLSLLLLSHINTAKVRCHKGVARTAFQNCWNFLPTRCFFCHSTISIKQWRALKVLEWISDSNDYKKLSYRRENSTIAMHFAAVQILSIAVIN